MILGCGAKACYSEDALGILMNPDFKHSKIENLKRKNRNLGHLILCIIKGFTTEYKLHIICF